VVCGVELQLQLQLPEEVDGVGGKWLEDTTMVDLNALFETF